MTGPDASTMAAKTTPQLGELSVNSDATATWTGYNLLLLIAFASFITLAAGEAVEEARFVISLLPMLGLIALTEIPRGETPRTSLVIPYVLIGIGVIILLAGISIDLLLGRPFELEERQLETIIFGVISILIGGILYFQRKQESF